MENERRYVVKTLGCKANLYDSQLIEAELQKRGWRPADALSGSVAELCIVNSCTVTDEADRQSRKLASRLSRDNPASRVVITGCSAEVDPERLTRSKGIHYVVGNRDKPKLVDLVLLAMEREQAPSNTEAGEILGSATGYAQMASRHPMDRDWPIAEESLILPEDVESQQDTETETAQDLNELKGNTDRTRAFLKIQDGCNSFCTYCVIPYGRGPSRSLKVAEVVTQVHRLVSEGYREVVITGINIGEYGADWADSPQVTQLFQAIFDSTRLERLRVGSLDPTEIPQEMLDLMNREPRFCPHFHVSLQSPHPRILKLMKRKYGYGEVQQCLKRISEMQAPAGGVFIGMDIITGFPGETVEEFEWTLEALRNLPWSRLHVFPYSEREGTPATRLPGKVSDSERIRRAKILRELSLERLTSICNRVMLEVGPKRRLDSVLLQGNARPPDGMPGQWRAGYTRNYLKVLVQVRETELSFKGTSYSSSPKGLTNQLFDVIPQRLWVDPASGEVSIIAEIV